MGDLPKLGLRARRSQLSEPAQAHDILLLNLPSLGYPVGDLRIDFVDPLDSVVERLDSLAWLEVGLCLRSKCQRWETAGNMQRP